MNALPPHGITSLPTRWRFARTAAVLTTLALLAVISVSSCASSVVNRVPIGENFPKVQGKSLDGEAIALPLDEPSVLLVGYAQDAQFDADRWLVGLLQVTPAVRILEVPAVAGLFPRLLSGTIDDGMRSGIPSEDWQSVVTCYGSSAKEILTLTGNQKPRNIRVLLLDADGTVRWFHDRGFSAGKLLELNRAVQSLTPREDA